MEVMYRVCRDVLNMKPILSMAQFFTKSFPEKKIQISVEIIKALALLQKELQRLKPGLRTSSLARDKLSYHRLCSNTPATTHIVQAPQTQAVVIKATIAEGMSRTHENFVSTSSYNVHRERMEKTQNRHAQQPLGLVSDIGVEVDNMETTNSKVLAPKQVRRCRQSTNRDRKFKLDPHKFLLPPKVEINPISMATEDESLESISTDMSTHAKSSSIQVFLLVC